MKKTWEKIFKYASMPVHGTMSRKITGDASQKETGNTNYDWAGIVSIRTTSPSD